MVGTLADPPLEPGVVLPDPGLLEAPLDAVDVVELEPVPGSTDIVVLVMGYGVDVVLVELAGVLLEPAAAVVEVLVTEFAEVALPGDVEVEEEDEEEDEEEELDEEPPSPGATLQLSGVGDSW